MSAASEFVRASVAHQLGGTADRGLSYDGGALDLARSASSKLTLEWDHVHQRPAALNGWQPSDDPAKPWQVQHSKHSNAYKIQHALQAALNSGADFDLLIDMQDHLARNVITQDAQCAPLLTFNRPVNRATGKVLWPLPVYHDVEGEEFLGGLDPDAVPWDEKADRVVWRGGPGNRGRLGKHGRGGLIRMYPLLRRYKAGKLTKQETLGVLRTMTRFRCLDRYIDDPRFDIGYTNSDGFILREEPFLDVLERPRIGRTAFQGYKYILVLPGNDVASSFYWTMNSGSVGLVVECDFETFGTHHFRPWEHYVPIRKDQRDIEDQLAWCADHAEECQAIAQRASEKCKYLSDMNLRQKVNKGVIDGMRAALGAQN